jgi:hypothetical protein
MRSCSMEDSMYSECNPVVFPRGERANRDSEKKPCILIPCVLAAWKIQCIASVTPWSSHGVKERIGIVKKTLHSDSMRSCSMEDSMYSECNPVVLSWGERAHRNGKKSPSINTKNAITFRHICGKPFPNRNVLFYELYPFCMKIYWVIQ